MKHGLVYSVTNILTPFLHYSWLRYVKIIAVILAMLT